jgi:hypothetical protein
MKATQRLVVGGLATLLPLAGAEAQARRDSLPPRVIIQRTPSATELIARRRALELTPQQLTRLDAIEREQYSARQAMRERMLQLQDSVCANRRPCVLTPEEGQRFRAQREQMQPQREQMLRADSAARAQAYAVLDGTQRERLQSMREQRAVRGRAVMRERMAERRGPRAMGFRREGMRGVRPERRQIERRMRQFDGPRFRQFDRPDAGPGLRERMRPARPRPPEAADRTDR